MRFYRIFKCQKGFGTFCVSFFVGNGSKRLSQWLRLPTPVLYPLGHVADNYRVIVE